MNEQTKTPGAVTLNYIVSSILNKRGDYSIKGRKRLLQFAIEGCREFRLYHMPSMEVEWIKINKDLMTVPLPDQLMQFKAVGIPINGEFWEFTEVDDRIEPQGQRKLNKDHQEAEFETEHPAPNFAYPGGQNEYLYSYDKANRRLVIYTAHNIDEVLVVYKSTGINEKGNTYIPVHAIEALKAYVQYQDIDDDPSIAQSEKMRKFQMLEYHKKNMRDIENMFTPQQFLDAIRSGYGQTIKR